MGRMHGHCRAEARRSTASRSRTIPAIVQQKSRDFYWYSPVLKRQLDHVTADLRRLAEERGGGRSACSPPAIAHGMPVTPRGAGTGNYGQAMPLVGRRRARASPT